MNIHKFRDISNVQLVGKSLEKEINGIIGSKVGSIKSRLHNTMKSLRKALKEEWT